jgi:hypothetical protein
VMGFGLAAHWHAQLFSDPVLGQQMGREQADALMRRLRASGEPDLRVSA